MTKSLRVQIREAEQQVLHRRHTLGLKLVTLANKIHQQLTAPATLLLTSGVGFIIGEVSKHQTCKANDGQPAQQSSPLTKTMSLVNSMRTIYLLLPLAWMFKPRPKNSELLVKKTDGNTSGCKLR